MAGSWQPTSTLRANLLMDHRADNEKQLLCHGCGKAFAAFLGEMAEHNAEVVCPHCGKIYTRAEAAALAKALTPNPAKRATEN